MKIVIIVSAIICIVVYIIIKNKKAMKENNNKNTDAEVGTDAKAGTDATEKSSKNKPQPAPELTQEDVVNYCLTDDEAESFDKPKGHTVTCRVLNKVHADHYLLRTQIRSGQPFQKSASHSADKAPGTWHLVV